MPHSIRSRASAALLAAASIFVLLGLAGCSRQGDASADAKQAGTANASAEPVRPIDFKIGLMTGTVSQGEDEFRAGQMIVAKYGADHVKHVTYPDNFMQE